MPRSRRLVQPLARQQSLEPSSTGVGNRVTCQRFNTIATLSTYAQAPGLTGQWWCSAHYGGNLGGIWDCLSTNGVRQACDTDVPTGTQVRCGQR